MIILRTHNGHVVGGECTECGPSTAGILSIPVELDFNTVDEDDGDWGEFGAALVEAMNRPLNIAGTLRRPLPGISLDEGGTR